MKSGATTRKSNPIASRLRQYCREHDVSLRELSRRAGLSPTGAQKIADRLETDAGDVGMDSLIGLARAMNVSLVWLLYGDHPPDRILLRTLPAWPSASREAIERLGADPLTVEAIGGWYMHEPPPRLDALVVAALARAWRGGV